MSLSLMNSVWSSRLGESSKMVMLVLAADANDAGYGVLSDIEDVLQRTSMSAEEIGTELNALESIGILSWEDRQAIPAPMYKIDCDILESTRNSRYTQIGREALGK